MGPDDMQNVVNLDEFRGQPITEDMAAQRFALIYAEKLVYCHSYGAWFEFDGSTWVKQDMPYAFHYARILARQLSGIATGNVTLQKMRFAAEVERGAKSDPLLMVNSKVWDKDIYLLGTPSGTVNLRTGELQTSNPKDYISRATSVAPDDVPDCYHWNKFLDEATGGDADLKRYLQQIAGYSLTGDTREQCLFFCHGEGGRGKGTFVNTLQSILGGYATTAAMEILEASRHSGHSTSVAMLNGARLVTSSETEEGKGWAEARIKQFTGQDPITARFMRQDDFTFLPQFKLVIMGNFQPSLRTVDEAMRRRFNMVPFTIIPSKKDQLLPEKLKKEYPGILRWAIEGCLDWQANGFVRPKRVIEATNEYFDNQNTFGEWLKEYCEVDLKKLHGIESATDLFSSWSKYAKANGEDGGSQKTFSQSLIRNGFVKKVTKSGKQYAGISLINFQKDSPFPGDG